MISIGTRTTGAGSSSLVIAELGTSHQGDLGKARTLIEAAARAGADCIKFQLVHADEILHPRSGIVELPTGRVELYETFKRLERDLAFYAELKAATEATGALFLCPSASAALGSSSHSASWR
jgi:sialic acid synthase SpsE